MALGLQFISKVRNYQIYADLNVRHSQVSSYRFASSKSASSSRYLARQKRDPYVRARESSGNDKGVKYVSRSAFKLEQLNEAYKFLGPSKNVVDLGAAPGGWSQVALKLGCNRVFALDLLPLHESVLQHQNNRLTFIQGDFRSKEIQKQLKDIIIQDRGENGKIDVIMSDMMANTSGNPIRDSVASIDLLHSALDFAKATLISFNGGGQPEKSPSVLIMKYFEGNDAQEFKRDYLQPSFTRIVSKKAAASRSESSEMYFICFGLKTQTQIVTNKIQ